MRNYRRSAALLLCILACQASQAHRPSGPCRRLDGQVLLTIWIIHALFIQVSHALNLLSFSRLGRLYSSND